jgi:hypothetical protein
MLSKLQTRLPSLFNYTNFISDSSLIYDVPEQVIQATIVQESGGNSKAWNPSLGENSRGLMQISELLAKDLGYNSTNFNNLFDPETNIDEGAKHLANNRDKISVYFDKTISEYDKWKIISSAYNQGSKYWIRALKTLKSEGYPQSWASVLGEMGSTNNGTPNFTLQSMNVYGPSVLSYVDANDLSVDSSEPKAIEYKALKVAENNPWVYFLPILAISSVVGYYYMNKNKKGLSYGTKRLTN